MSETSVMSPSRCGHFGHRNSKGLPCGQQVLAGTKACRRHTGKNIAVAKAEGQVRVELAHWGTDDSYVDPGEQFLRLIAQSSRRCELYSALLEADYQDRKVSALVGVTYSVDVDAKGELKVAPTGEYIRGLAELESRERRFCADLCGKAIAAGIEARKVMVAEQQGAQLVAVLVGALGRLGLDGGDVRVREAVAQSMLELGA
jgi:hypothetical protein